MLSSKVLSTLGPLALSLLSFGHLKADDPDLPTHVRRPIAAALLAGDRRLVVANQRSGTLSLIDCEKMAVIGEFHIGEGLSDIVALDDSRLLVVDEERNELIALMMTADDRFRVMARVQTSGSPVRVVRDASGQEAVVTCLWSRQVDVIDLSGLKANPPQMASVRKVALNFSPRDIIRLPGPHAVVADAFDGSLAVLDVKQGTIAIEHQLGVSNIRGLALAPSRAEIRVAYLRHDLTKPNAESKNEPPLPPARLRVIKTAALFRPLAPIESSEKILTKLRLRNYALPPREMFIDADVTDIVWSGELPIVAIGGLDRLRVRFDGYELLPNLGESQSFLGPGRQHGTPTGEHPVALVITRRGNRLYAINRLGDSVTVVDVTDNPLTKTISLGPMPPLTPADRGERLFYDARLSAGGWMSCHSCHTDGHTSGILADTLGDGGVGAPKRTPTLLGTRLTDPWAWNGSQRELGGQVHQSLATTLHAKGITPEQVNDLTAFLHTLPPPPPLRPPTDEPEDIAQLARGKAIFAREGCGKCHVPPLTFTSPDVYDVGLVDELGNKKFNPPSLRGVSQNYRFFHDGRAESLEAVFTEHDHMLKSALTDDEVADLVRYLEGL